MRGKYIVISAICTLILFGMLVYLDRNITGAEMKTKAYVLVQDVDSNTRLDKSMLEEKNVPAYLAANAIDNISDIEGKYALTDLYSGEVLRREKIGSKNESHIIDVPANMRKLAIPVTSLSDGVAGQIARNTYVDIVYTNTPSTDTPVVKTETLLQHVKVVGVTDSNGILLENSSGQVASVILEVTPEQAHMLINRERKGKFRLLGDPENAENYKNIVVY